MTKQTEKHDAIRREVLTALDRLMLGIEATKGLQPVRIRRSRGRNGRVSSAVQN
jgi:hypothetical protein